MELTLSYWDALDLLNIESEKDAQDYVGLCIAPDGITLIVESYRDVLTPGEIAKLLRQYPHAERGAPILTFPVAWPDFKQFIEMWSLVGYVDAVKAVDWVLERLQPGADQEARPEGKQSSRRADSERNHNAVVGLLTLAVVKRGGPGFRKTTMGRKEPNLSAVAKELLALAKDEGIVHEGLSPKSLTSRLSVGLADIDTDGLSFESLPDHLSAGQAELEERRLGEP